MFYRNFLLLNDWTGWVITESSVDFKFETKDLEAACFFNWNSAILDIYLYQS